MNHTGKLITILLILLFVLLVGVTVIMPHFVATSPSPVACTQEVRQCPDGSYVGRTGPDCAFAVCPTPTTQGQGILQGTITIGPVCPVEQAGHPCNPTPEIYAAHRVFVYSLDRVKLFATLTPDARGRFSTTLSTGSYTVDVQHRAVGSIKGAPATITIISGQSTNVTISVDTGIR